jgi:pimeloyl-ACP methyl ester carboxylesterase
MFPSRNVNIAFHIIAPPHPRGAVFVLHGYLGFLHDMAAYITGCIDRGYGVVLPELPGHGLSGGEPAGIDDFAHYGTFLGDLVSLLAPHTGFLPQPWHAIGHSTGATTIWEYLRQCSHEGAFGGTDPFDTIALVAPLVRSAMYRWSLFLRKVSFGAVEYVPTRKQHELLPDRMPMAWFDAQVAWNQRSATFRPISRRVYIYQGTWDGVVAWRYNRLRLMEVFPDCEYTLIPRGTHVMHHRVVPSILQHF